MSSPPLDLPLDPATVKGFLSPAEGDALYRAALAAQRFGPVVEIGSYCGKSALYLGMACKSAGTVLFSVDHHRGSEEIQPGWDHHDPELWDETAGAMDSLPFFRKTLRNAGLEGVVVALVGRSAVIATHWATPLSMLFIDGGHARDEALTDYRLWTPFLRPGGLLAIHDVFPDPADGGRPPHEMYEMALASGLYEETAAVESLRILRRLGAGTGIGFNSALGPDEDL